MTRLEVSDFGFSATPSDGTMLTLRRQPGLTDLLVGDTSLEQTVQTTTYPSLDFLASGSRTSWPRRMDAAKSLALED